LPTPRRKSVDGRKIEEGNTSEAENKRKQDVASTHHQQISQGTMRFVNSITQTAKKKRDKKLQETKGGITVPSSPATPPRFRTVTTAASKPQRSIACKTFPVDLVRKEQALITHQG
jgi:ATP adenylyltransferase/5',5'''-P-1,P-4-tetraphosphate phosphorylase II